MFSGLKSISFYVINRAAVRNHGDPYSQLDSIPPPNVNVTYLLEPSPLSILKAGSGKERRKAGSAVEWGHTGEPGQQGERYGAQGGDGYVCGGALLKLIPCMALQGIGYSNCSPPPTIAVPITLFCPLPIHPALCAPLLPWASYKRTSGTPLSMALVIKMRRRGVCSPNNLTAIGWVLSL